MFTPDREEFLFAPQGVIPPTAPADLKLRILMQGIRNGILNTRSALVVSFIYDRTESATFARHKIDPGLHPARLEALTRQKTVS